MHAALLKSGQVLFITADETTLLWDPEDPTPSTWEDPVNQPHTMPNGYSQLCGHHVQLSDSNGSLLSVGGGGYGPNALAKAGYIFDPVAKQWRRSANDMVNHKWYPTAVSLGGKKVLVASGRNTTDDMEIFDENSETFSPIAGDDRTFPNIYPGLHILPNNAIFYSRTGFGTAGAGPGGTSYDDDTVNPMQLEGKRPAYFTFNPGYTGGTWQKITTSPINRTKGMSVVLNSPTPPYVRVLVVGGADAASNDTYEIFDASTLTPAASFDPWQPVPDGENRSLCSLVLLPDGNVFVCGGISSTNSPCTMFDPQTNTWSAKANLPSARQYHSVAILLPSGKVMMAGWYNTKIEIYSPPYLFKGARPQITTAPSLVHHGAAFSIESPQAATIAKVVFVRPMAVTHQTDSEQRVIDVLPLIYDPMTPTTINLTAPDGGHPHPMAPRGHYMMFAIDINGIPSVAEWIYLH
ncbi:MAG: galactose oxidase-like domain-containing protein [Planctomycetota bacterium]